MYIYIYELNLFKEIPGSKTILVKWPFLAQSLKKPLACSIFWNVKLHGVARSPDGRTAFITEVPNTVQAVASHNYRLSKSWNNVLDCRSSCQVRNAFAFDEDSGSGSLPIPLLPLCQIQTPDMDLSCFAPDPGQNEMLGSGKQSHRSFAKSSLHQYISTPRPEACESESERQVSKHLAAAMEAF